MWFKFVWYISAQGDEDVQRLEDQLNAKFLPEEAVFGCRDPWAMVVVLWSVVAL